jgi:hypothetical protein
MHEQVYAWLLRLYPVSFRDEYADEALQLFRDRLNDEQGLARRVRLWFDIMADLGVSLWREHRRPAIAGSMPAAIQSDASGTPHLHLLKDRLPVRHLLYGAFFSIFVFGALSLAVMQDGGGNVPAGGPQNFDPTGLRRRTTAVNTAFTS